ncbi:ubiquinol-cytochrome C chaperone family protein [Hypericibacter sp.]|uniref:ubiquinol-cytochrome C chaperone family protein n=1 Tax=Hypericibacter sp. TaxID=2705401 RepID=UPI003D6C92F4
MSWFAQLFRSEPQKEAAERLYAALVAQAREPAFYREGRVPDSLDGRFELVALHAFLLLRRLQTEGQPGARLAQALFDRMFVDMDESLREIGVGDLSVGKRVKAMAKAFYGRAAAYEAALADPAPATLEEALARNLYGTLPDRQGLPLAAMAQYLRRAAAEVGAQPGASLLAGRVSFPAFV